MKTRFGVALGMFGLFVGGGDLRPKSGRRWHAPQGNAFLLPGYTRIPPPLEFYHPQ